MVKTAITVAFNLMETQISHPMDILTLQHPGQQGGWQASDERKKKLPQEKQPVSYEGAKTAAKEAEEKMAATTSRLQQQGQFLPTLNYWREAPVTVVQLRTGHSRLRHHMFTKFCIGESSAPHCGTSPMTVEHFLQNCHNHQNLRAVSWPADTWVREKIYRPVDYLQCIGSIRLSYQSSCLSKQSGEEETQTNCQLTIFFTEQWTL